MSSRKRATETYRAYRRDYYAKNRDKAAEYHKRCMDKKNETATAEIDALDQETVDVLQKLIDNRRGDVAIIQGDVAQLDKLRDANIIKAVMVGDGYTAVMFSDAFKARIRVKIARIRERATESTSES